MHLYPPIKYQTGFSRGGGGGGLGKLPTALPRRRRLVQSRCNVLLVWDHRSVRSVLCDALPQFLHGGTRHGGIARASSTSSPLPTPLELEDRKGTAANEVVVGSPSPPTEARDSDRPLSALARSRSSRVSMRALTAGGQRATGLQVSFSQQYGTRLL